MLSNGSPKSNAALLGADAEWAGSELMLRSGSWSMGRRQDPCQQSLGTQAALGA